MVYDSLLVVRTATVFAAYSLNKWANEAHCRINTINFLKSLTLPCNPTELSIISFFYYDSRENNKKNLWLYFKHCRVDVLYTLMETCTKILNQDLLLKYR